MALEVQMMCSFQPGDSFSRPKVNREPGDLGHFLYFSDCLLFPTLVDDVSKAFDDSTVKGELQEGRPWQSARCQVNYATSRQRRHWRQESPY